MEGHKMLFLLVRPRTTEELMGSSWNDDRVGGNH